MDTLYMDGGLVLAKLLHSLTQEVGQKVTNVRYLTPDNSCMSLGNVQQTSITTNTEQDGTEQMLHQRDLLEDHTGTVLCSYFEENDSCLLYTSDAADE